MAHDGRRGEELEAAAVPLCEHCCLNNLECYILHPLGNKELVFVGHWQALVDYLGDGGIGCSTSKYVTGLHSHISAIGILKAVQHFASILSIAVMAARYKRQD